MKERGILFSAPMVRVLLAGKKTQTRRVVRELPGDRGGPVGNHVKWFERGQEDPTRWCGHDGLGSLGWVRCPYGEPGDRLWVRETWRTVESLDAISPICLAERVPIRYMADKAERGKFRERSGRTRPGIHMPRWASRIMLEVTGVRVERVQSISGYDAIAEGIDPASHLCSCEVCSRSLTLCPATQTSLGLEYADLWRDINGAESWDANPWVWVVEFRPCSSLTDGDVAAALQAGARERAAAEKTLKRIPRR
jgi:hypothetical protein